MIQEANIQGVSTRRMDDLIQTIDGSGTYKSWVSRSFSEIDWWVQALLKRLMERAWPILWIDAICVKAWLAGRIVSVE